MTDPTVTLESRPSTSAALELQKRLMEGLATNQSIPSGILHRCAAYSSRIRDFSGAAGSPAASQGEWQDLYHELAFSRLHGSSLLSIDAIKARGESYNARGLTPIFVADTKFEIVRPRFFVTIQRYLAAQSAADAFPLDAHPVDHMIESRRAFFATAFVKTHYGILAPLPRVHRGLTVQFVVPRDGFFSNHSVQLEGVEVDFGRGAGYQPVQLDVPVTVSYAEPGVKNVRLRCSTPFGLQHAQFGLEVALAVAPPVDATWKLSAYQGVSAEGHAWVFYGSVNGVKKTTLTQPVIVAEGFPGNYPLDYLWERLNQQGLATSMLADGRDLVILGFEDGTLPIQTNAMVAVSCIQRAITERSGTAPLTVSGASMGGLITRYALTYMEKNNLPHQTSKFFTLDSPHGGATIPPSIQAFVQYISVYQDSAKQAAKALASAAAQQMLLIWIPPYSTWGSGVTGLGQSPLRSQFLNDLTALGWMPRNLTSAAVADGVGTGAQNGDTPGAMATKFSATACIWANCLTFPLGGIKVTFAEMECNKVDALTWTWYANYGGAYDSAPGGQTNAYQELYNTLPGSKSIYFPNACFIPTVSACAVNVGLFTAISQSSPSDFNHIKFSTSQNLMHIDMSAELAQFLSDFIRGNVQEELIERVAETPMEEARRHKQGGAAARASDRFEPEMPHAIGQ